MGKAIGTALVGLGVTIASTFAPSLGLSVHAQRIGFFIGVLLVIAGGVIYLRHRHQQGKERLSDRVQALSDEVAALHSRHAIQEPSWNPKDWDRQQLEHDHHRRQKQSDWASFVPKIDAVVDAAIATGVEVPEGLRERHFHILAGVHPIQETAGSLAILAERLRKARR